MMTYDVAFSFADEDRDYVARVAESLKARAVPLFYDRHHESRLWGKNLLEYFDFVYRKAARFFCVAFISQAYADKPWTNYERKFALDRAFRESREYVLPARFDDTEIPGIPSTVAYIDLRTTSPEKLADLICDKMQDIRFESSDAYDSPGFRWFTAPSVSLGEQVALIRTFQHLPIRFDDSALINITTGLIRRIIESVYVSPEGAYWTTATDSRFDRIYATSSVLTALCQLGGIRTSPLLENAIGYLKHSEASSIDDRAATIFLLLTDDLPSESVLEFLNMLAERQRLNTDPNTRGSFLLSQGPEAETHWGRHHTDGWSFHACHISDALLHIPSHLAECRARAEPILSGIREFMIRSYTDHDGWLVDVAGRRTPLTLFSYALCLGLGIPLPREWRSIGAECMSISSQLSGRVLTRFFGVMNAAYAAQSIRDDDFTATAVDFVRRQLNSLPDAAELDRLRPHDLAGLLRSVAYGTDLIDRGLWSSIRTATMNTLDGWDSQGLSQ